MMAFSIQPGDFIASCSGTIGELFRIPKGAPQGIINQALMKITVDEDIVLPEFFESLFRYHIKDHIFISGSKGSGLKNVSSMKIIKEAVFIVPDLLSQKRFVDINKSLSEQKGGILKGLKSADCAFNALLQKAFKGELT